MQLFIIRLIRKSRIIFIKPIHCVTFEILFTIKSIEDVSHGRDN